ncbi:MAG: type IV secretory system conjugative DNA transfer family protein [Candidatus Thiodiazotropha sp. (ex Codakia orbicularis)]|nr:type IV secretory system conjugative DNA transfer family protein [Candidatus Thiodiazotropha sp. (ex Codakia orbicularis)]
MPSIDHELLRGVPRGVSSRYLKEQSVPQARFQDVANILKSRVLEYRPDNPDGKVLVGAVDGKLIGIEDNRHILTVAGSRSGKSVGLISNLLHYRGSALVTDPKGELAAITAQRRAALGQKVYVLDPFCATPARLSRFQASYNPLSVLKPDSPTIIEDAALIIDALVIQSTEDKDPHWNESARAFIEGVILHVATDPRYDGKRDLVTVRKLIMAAMTEASDEDEDTEEEPFYVLELEMLENAARLKQWSQSKDLGAVIEGAANDFYERPERERSSVLSTARRHTKFLDYPAFKKVLRGHNVDLSDLKSHPSGVSLFLCFPATRIEVSQRWLRLFINQLLEAMEREKTVPPVPVLACLDEFPVLGYMKQLENAAGQIASFHVKLWVILQDWSQGKALYKERWETFVGNAGILQFFGINDVTTAEYISKRLGKTRVMVSRQGEVGHKQQEAGLSGRTSAAEQYDLLTPDELSCLFARNDPMKRELVLWTGYHPMILQRVEYYDVSAPYHAAFAGTYEKAY